MKHAVNTTLSAAHASASATSAATLATPRWRRLALELLPAGVAGLVAVLVSYAGPFLIVLQAAQAGQLSAAQTASWVWAISVGAGLCSAWMSWRYKMPIICAWNTPGAALLVGGLATLPYSQVIGAYLVAAAMLTVIGLSGLFERLVSLIPKSLCAAMLAGILFRFGVEAYAGANSALPGAPALVAAMFVGYLVFKRYSSRYAVALTLLLGLALWLSLGWGGHAHTPLAGAALALTQPVWTTPAFSLAGFINLALPLAVLCLTGQQLPGVAVLRAAHYAAPASQLVAGTGLASLLLAPFGAHGVNLAAITAAICTGPEAHPRAERRWLAGLACGLCYLLIGSFAGALATSFSQLPAALVATVAGLALLGAIQNGLVGAMAEPSEREAALVTFIVTASNIALLGLGSACWGLVLGGLTHFMLRPRAPRSASTHAAG